MKTEVVIAPEGGAPQPPVVRQAFGWLGAGVQFWGRRPDEVIA